MNLQHPSSIGMTWLIFRRELGSYFATPLAWVFIVAFLVLSGVLTFYFGGFIEGGQADLMAFFRFHPMLYVVFIPAVSMRLWAEERKSGSLELLLTLPVTLWQAVVAKFLAAWVFCGLALGLSFPLWITVNWLGNPDNGAILTGYLGSWLMAGGFLAIGTCISATTKNQVVAFVIGGGVCFLFLMTGLGPVVDVVSSFAPSIVVDSLSSLSVMTHYQAMSKGVIHLRDVIYFTALIGAWLYACALVVEIKKAD
jgi:ABC-2 type transport system permease protein